MPKVYQRILLATEGTEFDVGAERLAIDLAARCSLPLLAVSPLVSNPEFEAVAPKLAQKAEAKAVAHLDQLKRVAETRGVGMSTAVRPGLEPYQEIVAEAREQGADLIILRRRGKRGFVAQMLIGAMVHTVIGHAPCDVLIVPRAALLWSRGILLATDGSAHSDRATEAAACMAMRFGLPVTVVSVQASTPGGEEAASANVERAVRVIREAGAQATGRVGSGATYDAILEVGREVGADLIVVGRRGISEVERLLVGSTSERVAGQAECAVLIARA